MVLIIYCIYSDKHTKFSNRTKTSLLAHNDLLLLPVLRFQLTNGYAIKCLLSITSDQYIIANKSIKMLITYSDVAAWPNRHCKKCYCMCGSLAINTVQEDSITICITTVSHLGLVFYIIFTVLGLLIWSNFCWGILHTCTNTIIVNIGWCLTGYPCRCHTRMMAISLLQVSIVQQCEVISSCIFL